MRAAVALLPLLAACADPGPGAVRMDYRRSTSYWDAPFPSAALTREDGAVALGSFPNPGRVELIDRGRAMVEGSAGFGLGTGTFFRLDVDLDLAASPSDAIRVVALDGSGGAHPHEAYFVADGGPSAAPRWLAVLPKNGAPLAPATRYAVVLTTDLVTTAGEALPASPVVQALADGDDVDGMPAHAAEAHRAALEVLEARGWSPDHIAGLTVFTTHDPRAGFAERVTTARAELDPEVRGLAQVEAFDDFCVFHGTLTVPDHQVGDPPYLGTPGTGLGSDARPPDAPGGWSADGRAAKRVVSRVVLTVPRAPSSDPAGLPLAVFVRTGGGGDRPLVDRGVRASNGGPPIAPGTGPALDLARAGWAALSIDGPHAGARNPTRADEQFLMFDFANPVALRDNVRQSALELALLPAVIAALQVDTARCAGAAPVTRFDATRLALMGHSMGATIAPLTAWAATEYGAVVLSGAGASWLQNLLHKKKPLEVRVLAEALLGYTDRGATLGIHDPVLSLVQWAIEPADPLVYAEDLAARRRAGAGPQVLMFQGIVDHYIMPPIAHALSVPLALAPHGPLLDAATPELAGYPTLAEAHARVTPTRGAVVVQHASDGVEDGHEVMFQLAAPKAQYRCFLRDVAAGTTPTLSASCD